MRNDASFTGVVALSGFHYDGPRAAVVAVPRVPHNSFECFWSTGTGWGTFSYRPVGTRGTQVALRVLAGKLPCGWCEISGTGSSTTARSDGRAHAHTVKQGDGRTTFQMEQTLVLSEGSELTLEVHA